MKYKHLYRNKWLKTEPTELTDYYFTAETDDKGRLVKNDSSRYFVNEIVISERRLRNEVNYKQD